MRHRFADFELDTDSFSLTRAGKTVPLERRVFDLLTYLVVNADRVVSKEEITETIWKGRVVSPGSLTVAMSAARRALGDNATQQTMIATSPGRGYRFVAPLLDSTGTHQVQSRRDLHPPDFVGRLPEFDAFTSILDESSAGLAVFLIGGEAGIGKSRLLAEYGRAARHRSITMHTAHCSESERTPYLWPCVQLVRRMLQEAPHKAQLVPPSQASILAGVLPEWFPLPSPEPLADADAERFRTFEALSSLLSLLSRDQRTALAIDDLHRADEATLRFLIFAARELRQSQTLLIVTFRPAELPANRSDAFAALAQEPGATTILLQGLSAEDTRRLASAIQRRDLPLPLALRLHERTSGNPFYIREILAGLRGDQDLTLESVPLSLTQAILGRVRTLSIEAQSLLSTAATMGREFSISLLERACGLAVPQQPLDEAIAAGLVQVSTMQPDRGQFAHVLVRDVIYSSLGTTQRRATHYRIGALLDEQPGPLAEAVAAEIARHLSASRVPSALERALALAVQAGSAATLRSAHEDAAHHFALALVILDGSDCCDVRKRCNLLLLKGNAESRAGYRSIARSTLREAASIAVSIGATREVAEAALGVAPGFLAAEAGVADAALEELLDTALAALGTSEPELRALVASRLAMALHWTDQRERMRELMDLARECSTSSRRVLLHVKFAEWFCEWQSDQSDTRYAIAKEIYSLAEAVRDREMTLLGMVLRMVGMLERAELVEFDATLARFEELASHLRQPQSLWYSAMYRSMRALTDGRLDDAERHQAIFAATAARVNDANAFHSLAAQAAVLHSERGTLESMVDVVKEGVRQYPEIRGFRAGLSWLYASIGKPREAAREFAILSTHDFADIPQRFDWTTTVGYAAEACSILRDARQARVLYDLLVPHQGQMLIMGLGVGMFGPADRLQGLLAEVFGRSDQAEWHLERGMELVDRAGMPYWSMRTRVELASILLRTRRGSRAKAQRLAHEAAELGESAELPGLLAQARSLMRDAGFP